MATARPVLCPRCGAQVRKNGYCISCNMHIDVLRKAHNTSNYYYNIGFDKATARDLSGAVEALYMSLRYNKQNIMSRNLLGLIYYEMGEVVMALSHWVMSVNYQSNNNLAAKYLKEIKKDPARLENVDQIAKKFNAALGFAETNDYDLAILQLRSILSINPHFVQGYLLLSLIYIQENNYEKARTAIRRVLAIDKANPVAIHYLREMGDTDDNIIRLRLESSDKASSDEDYMKEWFDDDDDLPVEKHAALKEFVAEKKEKLLTKNPAADVNFVKYSGMYVAVGIVLGILLLFFVIVPAQKKKLQEENDRLIKSYSEEMAVKNASIKSLNEELEALNIKLEALTGSNENNFNSNPLPDYSQVQNGMSDEDLQNMINNE